MGSAGGKWLRNGKLGISLCIASARGEEAYELFENKRDGVIKVAVEC